MEQREINKLIGEVEESLDKVYDCNSRDYLISAEVLSANCYDEIGNIENEFIQEFIQRKKNI